MSTEKLVVVLLLITIILSIVSVVVVLSAPDRSIENSNTQTNRNAVQSSQSSVSFAIEKPSASGT